MSITIYGIKNCETMNKARAWLDKHGVDYAFHDYKTTGIDRERLEKWKGQGRDQREEAITLMLAQPSIIKRPVLDLGGGKLVVGCTPVLYGEKVAAG
jgi:arsenate reductase